VIDREAQGFKQVEGLSVILLVFKVLVDGRLNIGIASSAWSLYKTNKYRDIFRQSFR
jgi:hypothetical protein